MAIISGLLTLLIFIGIPVAIGVFIYRASHRRPAGVTGESAGLIVRRIFHYGISFAALVLVAIGLADLVALALPGDVTLAFDTDQLVARSLAFVIVGGPVLVGLGVWAARRHRDDPTEATSLAWNAYLTVATLTALTVAGTGALGLIEWALRVESFEPEPLADLIVWGVVFGAHWWLATTAAPFEKMRLHRALGSAIGLGGMAVGTWALLAAVLRNLYSSLFEVTLGSRFSVTWREALAGVIVGGAVWWWYWLRHASRDHESGWIRHTYLLLVGVLAGTITLVSSGARVLFDVGVWFFGDVVDSASQHFDGIPGTIAAALVGAWLWWYHRSVLDPSRREARREVDRVYDYTVSTVGLLSAATGFAILLTALFQSLAPRAIAGTGGARETLVFAVVMLLVGIPLWWAFWRRIEALAVAEVKETAAISRRLYLFLLFGVGGITALVSLLTMFGMVIEAVLGGEAGAQLWYDVRIPLALVVTVGAVAGYHWIVYRQDRRRMPAEPESHIKDLILVGGTREEGRVLADRIGARVQVWERLDNGRPPLMLEEIERALAGHEEEHLLVVAVPGGVEVVPFREVR